MKIRNKNGSEVTLNLSSNVVCDPYYKTNFPHQLLLTCAQNLRICEAFANDSSTNTKFSKTQLSQIVQSGGFLPEFLGSIPPFYMINLIANSYGKKINNIDLKELNNNLLIDTGIYVIGENIKK